MIQPKIAALDLDGTLFSRSGEITPYTREQIHSAIGKGVVIALSTGRPFSGVPIQAALELGIPYAITANGSAVYRIADKACMYEECIPTETAIDLLKELYQMHLHLDAFIGGEAYTQSSSFHIVRKSNVLPESVRQYILKTRNQVADLISYMKEHHLLLQKSSLIFERREDGTFIDREEAKAYLKSRPEVHVVSGGYYNLEFNKAGVSKATGLQFLCDFLKIPMEASMACGDSENDLDILRAAGFSVAMENAEDAVKDACDYITKSCDEDGVGYALAKFVTV